ncbi:alpha/beta hydrolase [Actinomadura fibrosa]|uniref:Alpha/beta hydrolase fold domain-containing protein n=1 Tax=Actinomadura fibrosa TaxID=111802 RepID=A0ABW2XRF5_9ACTN|nr:alpha/beta hydrolase [Actinomadura fibrosa]
MGSVDARAGGVRVVDGLVYGQPAGFRPLRLDLYLPSGVGAPLVVFVHGGGWLGGSRKTLTPVFRDWRPHPFERLAARGFAVASVGYRFSGEARWPAQLDDVAAAFDHLVERAEEFRYDAGRTVLWGESAGAHLAVMLGLREAARVSGVIDWYGPMDLVAMGREDDPAHALSDDVRDTREARLLGAPVRDVPELARAASPIAHVHGGAPPFLIAHGTADRAVPFEQSAALAAALAAAGASVRFEAVEGADHLWRGVDDLEPLFEAAVAFAGEVTGLG